MLPFSIFDFLQTMNCKWAMEYQVWILKLTNETGFMPECNNLRWYSSGMRRAVGKGKTFLGVSIICNRWYHSFSFDHFNSKSRRVGSGTTVFIFMRFWREGDWANNTSFLEIQDSLVHDLCRSCLDRRIFHLKRTQCYVCTCKNLLHGFPLGRRLTKTIEKLVRTAHSKSQENYSFQMKIVTQIPSTRKYNDCGSPCTSYRPNHIVMERGTPVQVTFLTKTSDINRTAQFVGMQPEPHMRTTLSHSVAPSFLCCWKMK